MTCPSCGHRKAKRQCPALGQTICSVCCGTKRLVEIACPDSCIHLSVARSNPAAIVRRQYEADVALLLPTIQTLTERQHQLFFLFQSVIARHRPEGFGRLADTDIADAAQSVAATLETAAKGVIYQHTTASPVAQKLGAEFTTLLEQIRQEGAKVYDHEAALTLRAIEQGARVIGGANPTGDSYRALMGRLLQVSGTVSGTSVREAEPASEPSSIILP